MTAAALGAEQSCRHSSQGRGFCKGVRPSSSCCPRTRTAPPRLVKRLPRSETGRGGGSESSERNWGAVRQRGHGERSSSLRSSGSRGCEVRREQELGEVVREGLESQTGCSLLSGMESVSPLPDARSVTAATGGTSQQSVTLAQW